MKYRRILKRHADDMAANVNPEHVIARYRRKLQQMQTAARQRHATHVAAWVALCPRESSWFFDAVQLLSETLKQRAMKARSMSTLPPRLQFALKLSEGRAYEGFELREGVSFWQELLAALPKNDAHARGKKGSALFLRVAASWVNCDSQEKRVDELEEQLRYALLQPGPSLQDILRSAVAALSPPRAKRGNRGSGEHMDISAIMRLQQGLQKRLRRIVLAILESGYVDSLREEPISQRLQELFDLYCCRTGNDIVSAAGGAEWVRIQTCLQSICVPSSSACSSSSRLPASDARTRIGASSTQGRALVELDPRALSAPGIEERNPPIEVYCVACSAVLLSKWMISSRGRKRVIVPQGGHKGCPVGSIKLLRSVDKGIEAVGDSYENINLCPHGLQRRNCQKCGSNEFCEHGKRRRRCPDCISRGLVVKRPRKS